MPITLAQREARKAAVTQSQAAFTAAGLTGVTASEIREGTPVPYALLGDFIEVVDDDFSDGDGKATRVTGSVSCYALKRSVAEQWAAQYVPLMTAEGGPSVSGFRVFLYEDPAALTVITTTEKDPGGPILFKTIVDHTLVVEPT